MFLDAFIDIALFYLDRDLATGPPVKNLEWFSSSPCTLTTLLAATIPTFSP